jgi:cell division protein FtsB
MWGKTVIEDVGDEQHVAKGALIPILTKAIQELSAKNDALEARIATLEG